MSAYTSESADPSSGVSLRFAKRSDWALGENELSQQLRQLKTGDHPLLDLSVSNPTRCGFDYSPLDLADAFHKPGLSDYVPDASGLATAREAVSAYYTARGLNAPAERLMLTASTSDAYNYLFRLLCDPGDAVLAPVPSYPLFQFLADINDVRLLPYPLELTDGCWRIDRTALEAAVTLECRALVLVNPNNPTGSYLREADRDFLCDFATRHGLALICDEVFSEFPLEAAPDAVHSLVGEQRVFNCVLGGLSKTLALPQMKFAWMVIQGPEPQVAAARPRLEMIADTFLSLNTPVQLAAPEWLEKRELIQGPLIARLSANLKSLRTAIANEEGLELLPAEGGWYAILRLRHVLDEHGFALKLLRREGVVVHPGYYYDFQEGAHAVLSLLTPPEAWNAGVGKLVEFYRREV